ncbi:DUF2004 domain-containing protein [Lachnospiraceae bacterium ZAX-1]
MIIVKTKYFGDLEINEESDFEYLDVKTNLTGEEKDVNIVLAGCDSDGKKTANAIEIINQYKAIDIINQYPEWNALAKKAIIGAFPVDKTVCFYFKCHFDCLEKEVLEEIFGTSDFEAIDINDVTEKLPLPNLLFDVEDGKLNLSVDYKVAAEYTDEILCVKVDESMNIIGFSQES